MLLTSVHALMAEQHFDRAEVDATLLHSLSKASTGNASKRLLQRQEYPPSMQCLLTCQCKKTTPDRQMCKERMSWGGTKGGPTST